VNAVCPPAPQVGCSLRRVQHAQNCVLRSAVPSSISSESSWPLVPSRLAGRASGRCLPGRLFPRDRQDAYTTASANVRSEIHASSVATSAPGGLAGAVRVTHATARPTSTRRRRPALAVNRSPASGWKGRRFGRCSRYPTSFRKGPATRGIHSTDGKNVVARSTSASAARRARNERSYPDRIVAALSFHIDKDSNAPVLSDRTSRSAATSGEHTALSRAARDG